MYDWFTALNPVFQALLAGLFTWSITAAGAATVFLTRSVNRKLLDSMLGFSGGVMLAASYWSLLAPAIEISERGATPSWFPSAIGFLLGGAVLWMFDKSLPHLHLGFPIEEAECPPTAWHRAVLLVTAITLHNIPEAGEPPPVYRSGIHRSSRRSQTCWVSFDQNRPVGNFVIANPVNSIASLIKRFGISNAQAAIDFRTYLSEANANALQYDASTRQYHATAKFVRLTDTASPDELPELLRGASAPQFDQLPDLKRNQSIRVLQPVYRTMRSKGVIEILYQSMRDPEPVRRMIAPVRFVSDGVRIHIRAWCFLREAYRDFHPARIDPDLSFKKQREAGDVPPDDEWNTWSIWKLIPHTRLSDAQKKAVRIEFDITSEYLEVRIRQALNLYAKRRWGLEQEVPRLECMSIDHVPMTEDEINAD